MSDMLERPPTIAETSTPCPGLEPGPITTARAVMHAAARLADLAVATQSPGHVPELVGSAVLQFLAPQLAGSSHMAEAIAFYTSPLWGEVVRRSRAGEGEQGYPENAAPPHPALRADLSPQGRGEVPRSEHLADLAVGALIAEAELSPKPGLVDARGAGAHSDVDLHSFLASARALRPAFRQMARAAEGRRPSQLLRERLAAIGRDGEGAMLAATGGANTHRGAIFALGLLVAAASIEGEGASPEAICATAGAIARFRDRATPLGAANLNGAKACRAHGVSGARGEAAAGFPHVLKALQTLRLSRAAGSNPDEARLDALMAVMASLDDTCLLHRGGRKALRVARLGARAVAAAGGASTNAGMAVLLALDRRLLALNASPGGAADMLACALFLDAMESDHHRLQKMARHGPARPDHPRLTSSSTSKMGPPVKPEDDGGVFSEGEGS